MFVVPMPVRKEESEKMKVIQVNKRGKLHVVDLRKYDPRYPGCLNSHYMILCQHSWDNILRVRNDWGGKLTYKIPREKYILEHQQEGVPTCKVCMQIVDNGFAPQRFKINS